MTLPADIIGEVYEKADGQMLFLLYPNFDETAVFHTNFNCTWVSGADDLDKVDAMLTAQLILSTTVNSLTDQGITVNNGTVIGATKEDHNGKPALSIVISYDVAYQVGETTQNLTLYAFQGIASHESIGTYTFTVTTADPASVENVLAMMDTITWNN